MILKRPVLSLTTAVFALFATTSIALAEGLPITPGLWEMTTQNPMTGADVVRQECVTEAVFDPSAMMGDERGCTIGDEAIDGNTVDYTMTCAEPGGQGAMNGHFSFTIEGDRGTGNVDMSFEFNGQTMNMSHSMSAQRVGDC